MFVYDIWDILAACAIVAVGAGVITYKVLTIVSDRWKRK